MTDSILGGQNKQRGIYSEVINPDNSILYNVGEIIIQNISKNLKFDIFLFFLTNDTNKKLL
jgi:hypothetical protein